MLTQVNLKDGPAYAGLPGDWMASTVHGRRPWTPEESGRAALTDQKTEAAIILQPDGSAKVLGLFFDMTIEGVVSAHHPLCKAAWAAYWQSNDFAKH